MTTATMNHSRGGSKFPAFLALVVMFFAGWLILQVTPAAQVVYHAHAVMRHGADAATVRQCQQLGPALQIWQKNNSDRFHCIFQLPDGRIGDQVVQLDAKGIWHEISSFARYEPTLGQVEAALEKEAQLLWVAP